MLTVADALDRSPRKILVAGVTGAGKTTLAGRIGKVLGVPHIEIDALFHGPDWTPRESFAEDVDAFTAQDAWVTEWQYHAVRQLLAARADTLVWLDLPFRVAFSRLVARTIRRSNGKVELWNGNVEPPLRAIFTERDHIIRWGWRTRRKLKTAVPLLEQDYPGLTIVRLTSQREVESWLARLH